MTKKIDWVYHRANCVTCGKSLAALTAAAAKILEQIDARKERIEPEAALKIVRAARHLWIARGKKIICFDLKKDSPSDDELLKPRSTSGLGFSL